MSTTLLLYLLAGASMLSAFIVTILNGLACAALQSTSPPTHPRDLTPVSLSAVNCVALVVLSVLVHQDVRSNRQWPAWKIGVLGLTGIYLVIAAGSTAGTMATDHPSEIQAGLWIARAIFWGVSVFAQGLYGGCLLSSMIQQRKASEWPRSYSQELKTFPESPSANPITPPRQAICDPYPEMIKFDTRRSSLRKYPRRSNRYSGGTLCLQPSQQEKYASFDTSSTIASPEQSPTKDRTADFSSENDTRPLLRGNGSIRSMPSLRQSDVHPSLDTLVQPSPTASISHPDSPSESVETLSPYREHHIHPLFRSTSPSPSPTPTPGTMVKASPSAGRTITQKTLTRMRSARSLRDQTMWTPSPMPGYESDDTPMVRKHSTSGLSLIHAGHVRRSITQYEKRYDLNESPDEK
ncbi:uncharacterized protein N7459_003837 [Penicillium hispanicum]|uniref:uncharacterized protein n=1 Tax=Penicillium hispanicum TaxID=1080232 RepID=UPI0025412EDD|nr:uncharacterized protein N7459_003837 [Penicillium hispanicum]KAJ5584037.1 hypothetical protein N7459_003837 [Penicillium hispanicum]